MRAQDDEARGGELLTRGIGHFGRGEHLAALSCFERSLRLKETPRCRSYLAVMIAQERGQIKDAVSMCRGAIAEEPHSTVNYLNLGRVFLRAGRKPEAIEAVREGLLAGGGEDPAHGEAVAFLNGLGTRKTPVLSFLPRGNFLNKYLGLLVSRLRLR